LLYFYRPNNNLLGRNIYLLGRNKLLLGRKRYSKSADRSSLGTRLVVKSRHLKLKVPIAISLQTNLKNAIKKRQNASKHKKYFFFNIIYPPILKNYTP